MKKLITLFLLIPIISISQVVKGEKIFSIKVAVGEWQSSVGEYLNLKTKWEGKNLNEKLVNLNNKKVIIKINPKLFRPSEVNILKGNSNLAKKELKWYPKTNLKQLVKIMIDEEIKFYKK